MGTVNRIKRPAAESGYDSDFYAWAMNQAALIRAAQVPGLDTENVAEEIESLGRSQKRELLTRCDVLLTHLLKWQFQPERRGGSWLSTIGEQRRGISVVLKDSPSLRRTMPGVIADSYSYAVKPAARETGLLPATFPAPCPWTPGEILNEDWMPGA